MSSVQGIDSLKRSLLTMCELKVTSKLECNILIWEMGL
jgi:hypothetical protein